MLLNIAIWSHSHGAALQTNHNTSFNHLSHGEHGGSIFVAQCKLSSYVIRQRFDIIFKIRTQSVSEMAALERIDMLRQRIEIFNFDAQTLAKILHSGEMLLFSEAHCVSI